METKGLRPGHIVALLGALAVLLSLFRPWYSVTFPAELREALGQFSSVIPTSLDASGWRELEGADVALCVGAAAVVALVLGAAGTFGSAIRVDPQACGSAIAAVGAASLAIVLVHVVNKPGPSQASDYVHFGSGIWIGLGGSVATLAGGLMAAGRPADAVGRPSASASSTGSGFARLDPELPPVFTAAPGTPGHGSVPPPAL